MPFERTIIPRDIQGFNLYINQTNDYLILGSPTNAVRFGWTPQNLLDWQAFRNDWNPLFFKYSDRKASYTTVIKTDLEVIINKAVAYDRENKLILKVKATVGLTPSDCGTFRIPLSYAITNSPIHLPATTEEPNKTTSTDEAVYVRFAPVGGGFVHVRCFTEASDSGRAHKLKGYDLVEYAVAVFYRGASNLPTHATDTRLSKEHSSKATFMLQTDAMTTNLPAVAEGETEPAKIAVFFFRWAKSKHPLLDGPWSGPYTTPLL
jgi:hypothetical protein